MPRVGWHYVLFIGFVATLSVYKCVQVDAVCSLLCCFLQYSVQWKVFGSMNLDGANIAPIFTMPLLVCTSVHGSFLNILCQQIQLMCDVAHQMIITNLVYFKQALHDGN